MPIKEQLQSWLMSSNSSRKVSFSKKNATTTNNNADKQRQDVDQESKSVLLIDDQDSMSSNGTDVNNGDQEDEDPEPPPIRKSASDQTLDLDSSQTESTILTVSSLGSLKRVDNEVVKVIESDQEAHVSLLLPMNNTKAESTTPISKTRLSSRCMFTLDVLLSLIVFSPLVGIYWFSTWTFIDKYFLTERPVASNFVSYLLGLLVLLPSYVLQQDMQKGYDYFKSFGKFGKLMRFVVRNSYMVILNAAIVAEWRGLWNLCDHYFQNSLSSQLIMATVAIVFFCLTRSTGSLISTPFIMYRDDHVQPFACESRFKFPKLTSYQQYLFDFFWAEVIECSALILAWRGIGGFYEHCFGGHGQVTSLVAVFFYSHLSYFAIIFAKLALLGKKFLNFSFSPKAIDTIKGAFNVLMFASSCLAWKFYWDLTELVLTAGHLQAHEFSFYIVCFVLSNLFAILFDVTILLAGPAASINETPVSKHASTAEKLFEMNYFPTILANK